MIRRGKQKTLKQREREPGSSDTLSIMNLTWRHLGLNLRLCAEKPVPNSLSYVTVFTGWAKSYCAPTLQIIKLSHS
jgi:hypothetical protein